MKIIIYLWDDIQFAGLLLLQDYICVDLHEISSMECMQRESNVKPVIYIYIFIYTCPSHVLTPYY